MTDLYDKNPELGEKIDHIVEDGDKHRHKGDFDTALLHYEEAWLLVPEPKTDWMMPSLWIASSFYAAYFSKHDYEKAKNWAYIALKVKSPIDTGPVVDMGMVCFELEQYDEAYKYFHDAYTYGKKRAFRERPPKYLEFYLDRSKLEK
ncbi:hypothetical protein FZU01_01265 [Salmonella enterica subsp. enterica]|nr:hypothetical protein [Salmonella enterica subsp. enterica serovar Kintambo]ECV5094482.1 hypothetical protein [Salmonella enterica subsp. enterica serovar Kintambo]